MHVDESYVGEDGYAHTGKLNLNEVLQIIDERRRRELLYDDAIQAVASGAGYVRREIQIEFEDAPDERVNEE